MIVWDKDGKPLTDILNGDDTHAYAINAAGVKIIIALFYNPSASKGFNGFYRWHEEKPEYTTDDINIVFKDDYDEGIKHELYARYGLDVTDSIWLVYEKELP